MNGKIVIDTEINTKNFSAQLSVLEDKLETLVEEYELLGRTQGPDTEPMKKLGAEIEKTKNSIISLKDKMASVNGANSDAISGITKGFDKGIKSLKRFGLSLLSVRSIYSIVSRASSAYLSQDIELSNKMKSIWTGLGAILSPVLEVIVNGLAKAVGYLNVFVKALTGVDLIAKANAKSLKAQANAQKELNNQIASFDELNVANSNSSSNGGGSSSLFEMPELDENIVKKLQDLAKWLKDNKKLVKELGIALLAVFGASAIGGLVSNIGTLATALGTAGLWGVAIGLTGYLVYETVKAVKDLDDQIVQLEKDAKTNEKQTEKNTQKTKELSEQYWELYQNGKLTESQLRTYINTTYDGIDMSKAMIKNLQEENKNWLLSKETKEANNKAILNNVDSMKQNVEILGKYYNANKDNKELQDKYTKALEETIKQMNNLGMDTSNLRNEYKKLTGQKWELKMDATINDKTQNFWNNLKNKIQSLLGGGKNSLGGGGGGSRRAEGAMVKHWAVGGIVNQPGKGVSLASVENVVGEAGHEAVIPLTDPTAMAELGQTIGKYVNIQVTSVLKANNKVLARNVQQASQTSSFARN